MSHPADRGARAERILAKALARDDEIREANAAVLADSAEARRLRDAGLTFREIATVVGGSTSRAERLVYRPPRLQRTVMERLWLKVDKHGPTPIHRPDLGPCWQWTAGLSSEGYGQLSIGPRGEHTQYLAHRLTYRSFVGPVPDGLEIDHLCRNRACCNPAHLEAVTHAENYRRGALGVLKTHCIKGHLYDEDNTYWLPNGRHRHCRTCCRESARRFSARKREEMAA